MKVDTDRKNLTLAGIFTTAMLLFIIWKRDAFFDGSTQYDLAFFITAGFLAILTGMLSSITFKWKGRTGSIINTIYFLVVPIISMLLVECVNSVFIYDYSPRTFLANYIVYIFFYLFVYMVCGSTRISVLVVTPILFIFSIACYFVNSFRGSPIVPFDVMTISTGLNVSSNYTYSITYNMVISGILFLFIMVSAFKFETPKLQKVTKISSRLISGGLLTALLVIFFSTDVVADNGFKPDFWDQARGYRNTGTILNFCLNTKYLHVSQPNGYDADDVSDILLAAISDYDDSDQISGTPLEEYMASIADIQTSNETAETSSNDNDVVTAGALSNAISQINDSLDSTSDETVTDTTDETADADTTDADTTDADTTDTSSDTTTSNTTPNIICIMNESLSDLSVLGDVETNKDYMPFIHSLTENTIKGNLYVPVNGAGTSNSEFEFLTGNSLSFLPAGSNVYQLYIDSEQASLATTLGSQGYTKTAFHPYYASGWNRTKVYPLLGFDSFISIEDMIDDSILTAYQDSNNNVSLLESMLKEAYPDDDMLLRRYISDDYDFDSVIDMYENRDTSSPFFLFNVTMQNHGGYALSYSNFTQQIYLTNTEGHYPMANRYLSLVYETDQAFEKLIDYFSQQTEPTIICMFGDHQPYLENDFFEEIIGSDLDDLTIEQTQSRYVTPFVIWANYDIDEEYVDAISSNYLSTLVLETAGVEMTDYNEYLSSLYQTLPVIDTIGYIDSEGTYYSYEDASPYTDLLAEYEKIQYNNLFDTDKRVNSLFFLDQ